MMGSRKYQIPEASHCVLPVKRKDKNNPFVVCYIRLKGIREKYLYEFILGT